MIQETNSTNELRMRLILDLMAKLAGLRLRERWRELATEPVYVTKSEAHLKLRETS
jgi:hypothetical protein